MTRKEKEIYLLLKDWRPVNNIEVSKEHKHSKLWSYVDPFNKWVIRVTLDDAFRFHMDNYD